MKEVIDRIAWIIEDCAEGLLDDDGADPKACYWAAQEIDDGLDICHVFDALVDLLDYVTSGRRYRTCNPYCVPEVKEALQALCSFLAIEDWIEAASIYRKRRDAENEST